MTTVTKAKAGASLQFAQRLFTRGTDVFGPGEIQTVFGIEIPADKVSPIPFSEGELQTARRLGEVLTFQVPELTMAMIHDRRQNKTSDGKPLFYNTKWYREEPFYTGDNPVGRWKLLTREVLHGSLGENYLQQTPVLVSHLGEVFGNQMPSYAQAAIDEFEGSRKAIEKLMDEDWQKAAEQLANLKMSKFFRPSPVEVLSVITMYEAINHERLLPNVWTWTNKRSSNGGLVSVGYFDGNGVRVARDDPRSRNDFLGACFSRGGNGEL
ncbi:MAG: hypothetical protein AAB726_02210 [Patescibacteria group bacterium]